ncbi:hypothetical protein BDW22DRAFT_1231090 [Trametopsis cervina]|nr:hypothetical protein BDW22DRAFT_1231090 [Trametopsis cervina]
MYSNPSDLGTQPPHGRCWAHGTKHPTSAHTHSNSPAQHSRILLANFTSPAPPPRSPAHQRNQPSAARRFSSVSSQPLLVNRSCVRPDPRPCPQARPIPTLLQKTKMHHHHFLQPHSSPSSVPCSRCHRLRVRTVLVRFDTNAMQ